MTRIWLIMTSILVLTLLLTAFVLYHFYPSYYASLRSRFIQKTETIPRNNASKCTTENTMFYETNRTLAKKQTTDLSTTPSESSLSLEDVLDISQEIAMQEYFEREEYQYVSLQKRFKETGTEKGDALFIRIFKEEALLEVWIKKEERYVHLKDYAICAYSGGLGPKLKEGDKQAPEGFYRVYPKQLNPRSKFHLAFNLGYPNAYDRAHHRTGSYLMVHGRCTSIGCYAMTDANIEEIYDLVESALKKGQSYVPVHIFPFKMEDEAMDAHSESRWYDFWMQLKEGYDYFEAEEIPPKVEVIHGDYVVSEAQE